MDSELAAMSKFFKVYRQKLDFFKLEEYHMEFFHRINPIEEKTSFDIFLRETVPLRCPSSQNFTFC